MGTLSNLEVIGIIATIIGAIISVLAFMKKQEPNKDNSINQNIKGGIFFGGKYEQNVVNKKGDKDK